MNVYEKSKIRFEHLYNLYDELICNFSAGKDSLAMFYVHHEIAQKLGRKTKVAFYNGEYHSKDVLDMVERIGNIKDVELSVLCMPTKDRNGCSSNAPFWYPWHPAEKHLWINKKPDYGIETFDGFVFEYDKDYKHPDGLDFMANSVTKALSFQDVMEGWHQYQEKITGQQHLTLIGVRALESLARYQAMTANSTSEKYITIPKRKAYPVYDWTAEDVWRICKKLRDEKAKYYVGYCREYELMNMGKEHKKWATQRVGTPFAEESLRGVDVIRLEYPDMWAKMIARVEGVKTAWRYCNTELYSVGKITKPENLNYEQFLKVILKKLNKNLRAKTEKQINMCIRTHFNKTNDGIPEETYHPLSGCSWNFLVKVAIKGDFRGRVAQKMLPQAVNMQKKLKLNRDQTVLRYGKKEYKEKYFKEIRNKKSTRSNG